MTPEGKVKESVKKVLAKYKSDLDAFWPVQTGFGDRHLDCIICFRGIFIAVETKKPTDTKGPSPLQKRRIKAVRRAGGIAVVIGGTHQTHNIEEFEKLLEHIRSITKLVLPMGNKNEGETI